MAEDADGNTGGGGTLNSPFMTTLALPLLMLLLLRLWLDFSLNETERNRLEDLLPLRGFEPADNFLVPFGGFPVAFGGDSGTE